ncbi:MAG: hypothetical protein QOK05_2500 [Chloroflexota bacterium]|jgi:nucleoside-diphosphate-sugar epimerase|nr:hypothetical protein [Chloroflexota bacterium]
MARYLVTGVAGFVGSTLAEALLTEGHHVLGMDAITDYYPPAHKREHLNRLSPEDRFDFIEADLLSDDLRERLRGVDVVFHLAGQPGVRASWGVSFRDYAERNILATQRLLEAARDTPLSRFVYASSSSIYGDAPELPTRETTLPQPVSPYGVTKLAAEHLCGIYGRAFGVPTVSLRYFTVYGPRQRPDMAFRRWIDAGLHGEALHVNGDGRQARDFTYVEDIVAGTIAAATSDGLAPGAVFNLGGGVRTTVNEVLDILAAIFGHPLEVERMPGQDGDARETYSDCSKARAQLGYEPTWTLDAGLRAQFEWQSQEPALAARNSG